MRIKKSHGPKAVAHGKKLEVAESDMEVGEELDVGADTIDDFIEFDILVGSVRAC